MKFTKKRNYTGTIRKVWSNDKEVCYGAVGTVGDMLKEGVLEYADYTPETWVFIPAPGIMHRVRFGKTREDAIAQLPE